MEPEKADVASHLREREFYVLLRSSGAEVRNLILPNEKVAWVTRKHSEDNIVTGEKC